MLDWSKKNQVFQSNEGKKIPFLISPSIYYVFDLKPIESSMLFAIFRPLRTPVPNDQSSHF
jgi:hypothetical protein